MSCQFYLEGQLDHSDTDPQRNAVVDLPQPGAHAKFTQLFSFGLLSTAMAYTNKSNYTIYLIFSKANGLTFLKYICYFSNCKRVLLNMRLHVARDLVFPKSKLGPPKSIQKIILSTLEPRFRKHTVALHEIKTSEGSPSHQAHTIIIQLSWLHEKNLGNPTQGCQ